MKVVARSYVWWDGIDKDIESQGKACLRCQEQKSKPPTSSMDMVDFSLEENSRRFFWTGCFLLLWMHIPSGQTWFKCLLPLPPRLLMSSKSYSQSMAYRSNLSLTMGCSLHQKILHTSWRLKVSNTSVVPPNIHLQMASPRDSCRLSKELWKREKKMDKHWVLDCPSFYFATTLHHMLQPMCLLVNCFYKENYAPGLTSWNQTWKVWWMLNSLIRRSIMTVTPS